MPDADAPRKAADDAPTPPPTPQFIPTPVGTPGGSPAAAEAPSGPDRTPWKEVLQASHAWQFETADAKPDYRKDAVVVDPCDRQHATRLQAIVDAVLPAAGWTVTFSSSVGGRFLATIA